MGFPAIKSHIPSAQGSYYVPLKDMELTEGLADFQLKQQPAELTIRTQSPDIQVNWRPVWNSIGLLEPTDYSQQLAARRQTDLVEAIGQKARDGDEVARSVRSGEKNIFGRLAQQKFLRDREVQTQLGLMPERGPEFSVQVYRPEIHFEVNPPEIDFIPSRPKVHLKPLQTEPTPLIDFQI